MKKKILILGGGISKEREISLKTAKEVKKTLKKKYKVFQCDFDQNFIYNLKKNKPDILFNALHGRFGEDGFVQSILESEKIKYTHSGVLSSALAMDKIVSKEIFNFLSGIKGVVDLESDMKEGQNELRIIPNYYKMGRLGVTVETVAHTLRVAFQGSVPTKIVQEGEEIDFRLQVSKKGFKDEKEILKGVQVMNQRGRLLDLLPLVKLQEVRGQTIIRHYNGKPSVTISSDLDEKIINSKKVKELLQEKFKDQIEGTPGLQVVFGGEEKATEESIKDFMIAFPFCILGIYFVLVILFNSLIQPFIILATIPFGLAGVVISFYIFNLPLSFLGIIGSLGLVGIIVNDGLIMVSHLNQISMGRELTMDLLLRGAKDRFRAVMLTTVTTVLGMAPTIIGIGGYEPFLVPIVLAVAGGLVFATTLILIFIPTLYSFKIKK